jgi:pantoate--beta-alanine ligase
MDAPIIYKTLLTAAELIKTADITDIKDLVKSTINKTPDFNIDYFEIVDDTELIPVRQKSEFDKVKRYFGCIAVKAGKIRLIDNIEISLL